jgi:hypothetical protein
MRLYREIMQGGRIDGDLLYLPGENGEGIQHIWFNNAPHVVTPELRFILDCLHRQNIRVEVAERHYREMTNLYIEEEGCWRTFDLCDEHEAERKALGLPSNLPSRLIDKEE